MHRTQVLLDERQYRFLQSQAKRQGKSLSAMLRKIVDEYMSAQSQSMDPLWDVLGMAEGESASVAREHDRHLYGDKV